MSAPMKDATRIVAVVLVVSWFVPETVAQSIGQHSGLTRPEAREESSVDNSSRSPHEMVQAAFDVGTSRMPARFQGNTVDWVLRYGTLAPRNGFETNSDYAARRSAFRSEVFAFVLDRHDVSYDRVAETLMVMVRPVMTRFSTHGGDYFSAFNVHRTKLPPISRAGPSKWSRNDRPVAAERSAVLSTTRAWKQTQIVTNERMFDISGQSLAFKLNVPRDRLGPMKSNIRVAFVCMPRLDQYKSVGDATVPEATGVDSRADGSGQFPDQTATYFVVLRCNLLQVWLFDFKTGEVYGRFTEQGVLVPRD